MCISIRRIPPKNSSGGENLLSLTQNLVVFQVVFHHLPLLSGLLAFFHQSICPLNNYRNTTCLKEAHGQHRSSESHWPMMKSRYVIREMKIPARNQSFNAICYIFFKMKGENCQKSLDQHFQP